ncbi:MAG TPA: type VI secretion system membrane subunit TssM [Burkholderiaceae bacterium]|nr:type VI secretion system membrane subunit TssM [Burkholderiaceae bacterium]
MKKLLSFFFNRWTLRLLGFIAIALLIWFVGPLVAIAGWEPLASETVRLIAILLVLFLMVLSAVVAYMRAQQKEKALVEGIAQQPAAAPAGGGAGGAAAAAPADAGARAEVEALRKRFETALELLKRARSAGKKGFVQRLTALAPARHLYELPWYLFIGAPGSGKTTALLNAGLRFPLAAELGPDAIRGVGGTRNCDWWFTDDAVLLDTAGRYTTQDSDRDTDAGAWQGFLQLLKKHRPRRPINGVLLTVSVIDLLTHTPAQRAEHAAALRKRVQELHDQLNLRFPIYVLVTKADLLAGFSEFFGDAGQEERAQVWGFTLPLPAPGAGGQLAQWRGEFDALHKRLNDRLLDRLQQERDVAQRALIYGFPQQFAALAAPLGDLLERVFGGTRFEEQTLLRGVYFTSGTQEGTPLDRVLGSLARSFGVQRQAVPVRAGAGRSFFLARLLRDLIFAEADVAGTDRKWERRRLVLHAVALGLAGLLVLGCLIAWTISYGRNAAYVADVQARVQRVTDEVARLDAAPSTDVVAMLPLLRSVRDLSAASTQPGTQDDVPWSMGFGLYQGGKLGAAADAAYRRLLRDSLLPRLALRIEQLIGGGSDPELLYEGLKAYLMLQDPEHFDAASLKAFITVDWDASLPRDVTQQQRQELEAHLGALFERGAVASPMPANPTLIASTRATLSRATTAQRIYNRLKRQGVGANLPEFTIAAAGGPSAPLVFGRASGQPLSQGVPGLFSFDGYHKQFVTEAERASKQLEAEESWVLGLPARDLKAEAAARLAADPVLEQVRRLYLQDYAATWEAFVRDIRVLRPPTLQQSIQLAQILSAVDSPLPKLLRAIVREVTLVPPDTDRDLTDKVSDTLKSKRDQMVKLLGKAAPTTPTGVIARPELIVDQRFDALRQTVTGKPAPIDQVGGLMGELYTHLLAVDDAQKRKLNPPPSEVALKIKAEAARLPDPVRSTMTDLSDLALKGIQGQTRGLLNEKLLAQVSDFCTKAITGRYPFVRSSTRDATPDDFARVFSGGGLMDEFVQRELLPHVDTSTRPWTFRKTGDLAGGDASAGLAQFERAQVIRDVFFRSGGKTPALRLELKPIEMDATITQFTLDVDGQLVRYSHGPQVPTAVQWPGPRGAGQVRLTVAPARAGSAAGQTFDGPWSLFRLFDGARIERTAQPEKFRVTFDIDGRKATFEVTTNSVQNPFRLRELEQFQCPGRL